MRYGILLAAVVLSACTDTAQASLAAYGDAADITCYSGGQVIFKGRSTGRIQATKQSDGWEFKDASTGRFTRISGTCVIMN